MLLENSLYSTPAERETLLKDKKLVMDALCFSLLGFLGCFKLGDQRAALKTYDQTEGQLRLNAIGDTNHDVSLSLKLADEAGVIPNSGAQNVTKLLYKIKSKQIKGKDLDDNQVRDLIKTLKISSHPGDSMVNAVVSEFEAGSLNLAQLAAKLFNLSKLPKFKAISGEFRTLVAKGQFTELFAKAGTVTPTSAKISNNSSAKVVTPIVAAPVSHIGGPFTAYPKDEQDGLYDELFYSNILYSALPKAVTNAGLTDKQMPSVIEGYANWVHNLVFVEKKYSEFTDKVCEQFRNFFSSQRIIGGASEVAKNRLERSFICGRWMACQSEIEKGDFGSITSFTNMLYVTSPATNDCLLPIFTEEFFKKIATDAMILKIYATGGEFIRDYESLIQAAWIVSGGVYKGPSSLSSVKEKTETWKFDTSLGEWWLRRRAHSLPATAEMVLAVYHDLDDAQACNMLNHIFSIKSPSTCQSVSKDSNPNAASFLVPVDIKDIKVSEDAKKIAGWLGQRGQGAYGLWFNDISQWETTLKKNLKDALSTGGADLWTNIMSAARQAMGMPKGYLGSEPFMNWFADQLEGSRAVSVFKHMPLYDSTAGMLYLNMAIHFLDNKGVSPGIWLNAYTTALQYSGLNQEQYQKDLETIYEENASILEKSLGDIFSTNIRDYAVGSTTAFFLLKMHKKNLFKAPNDKDFWAKLAAYAAADLGEWEIPDSMQEILFNLIGAVDQKVIRQTLLTKYEHTRKWYYNDIWMPAAKRLPDKLVVESFVNSGYTDVVTEAEVPKETMDYVKGMMKYVDPHERSYFDSYSQGYGEWLKKLVTDALFTAFAADKKISTKGITNAIRVMSMTEFNAYIEHSSQADLIKGLEIKSMLEGRELVFLWNALQKDSIELKQDVISKLLVSLGMNIKSSPGIFAIEHRKSCIDSVCDMLNQMMGHGREAEVDQLFDSMSYSIELKKAIVDWFSKAGVLANALKSIKGDEVAPLVDVDHSRLGTLMKYNNINVPTSKDVDYKKAGFKLSDFLKTHGSWKLEPLATQKDIDDQASCDRRTAEFDVFNKYRHGSIGVKFLKSFNVDLPIQREKNEIWDKAHDKDQVMDPVFHGTGSVAASFILRYGFAVVSSTDSSVVGRMLGDGIYFSNVLDKCGQYVSDGGYSRGKGNKGYLFQMRANLGKRGTDYQAGGGNLVSPEWCVFHPNDQLKIYKAHFIELVDKSEIALIKNKVKRMNESVMRIEEMTEYVDPDLQKGCISYTFVDGTIPIDEHKVIDFEEWDPSIFGDRVKLEFSGMGPILYIQVDDPEVAEIYAVRYTAEFMNDGDEFQKYLALLRGSSPT